MDLIDRHYTADSSATDQIDRIFLKAILEADRTRKVTDRQLKRAQAEVKAEKLAKEMMASWRKKAAKS